MYRVLYCTGCCNVQGIIIYRVFEKDFMCAVYRQYTFYCSHFHCIAATQSKITDCNAVARIRRKLTVLCEMPESTFKVLGICSVILHSVNALYIA